MVPGDEAEEPREAPSASRIARQVGWVAAGQATSQAGWYAAYVVLAALLAPEAFGTVAAGLAIVGVATLLMESGSGGSLIAARTLTRASVTHVLRLNVAVGLALSAAIALTAEPLVDVVADGGDSGVIAALGAAVLLTALAVVPHALLRRALDFRSATAAIAAGTVISSVAAVAAALAGAGVWALAVRQLVFHAVSAALMWWFARPLLRALPAAAAGDRDDVPRPPHQWAFLVVAAAALGALSLDNVVVGAVTDATQLGLYALAFQLAFAPLTQIAWQFGKVLFPAAAATEDLALVGRRTVSVVRLTALVLMPLVPVGVALAGPVVPWLLGDEWEPMVTPLRLLLVTGVIHAVLTTIAESLAGTGHMPYRARIEGPWAVATLVAVALLGAAEGIDGAALAHLVLLAPLALGWILGTRRIGSSPGELWRALRDVIGAVAVQAAVTAGLVAWLGDGAAAAAAAAAAGLLVALALLAVAPSRPLREGRALVSRAHPAT